MQRPGTPRVLSSLLVAGAIAACGTSVAPSPTPGSASPGAHAGCLAGGPSVA